MATQAERRAETRGRILAAATSRFAAAGYEATSTEAILADAGVSRGALYHHFGSKQELFEAVFVSVSDETIARALDAAGAEASPLEELIRGCLGWIRAVRRPPAAAIVLTEGPRVLGWKRARDLEARTSLGLMVRSLERAIAAGEVRVPSVTLAARYINAALAEAALASLHGERTPLAEVEASLRQLIGGLAIVPSSED